MRCQPIRLSVDNNDYKLSCPHAVRRQSNSPDTRWPFFFGWLCQEFDVRLHVIFLTSGITCLVLGLAPMGFLPRTPSFANPSFLESPAPVTWHSYLLHTLRLFVGKRA